MSTTDPRTATTLSEFISAGSSSAVISFPKLCFCELDDFIKYTVLCVLDDYIYELKQNAKTIIISSDNQQKYHYNPKLLASDIYGSTELYYVIMLINDICDTKQFNLKSGTLKMLTVADMSDFLNKIYTAEKADIVKYNSMHAS